MWDNLKNISGVSERGALCVGGYIGWYLTVLYICRRNLEIYGTSTFFDGMRMLFGGALLGLLAIMLLMMFHLDFEGLLGHRYFRAVPAILMAESGVALAFTNADSFGVYAVITGLCASFGVLAVFSSLLRVRVSQRIVSVALGTALGGAVRLTDAALYDMTGMTRGIFLLTALSGLLVLLTVRSSAFSKEDMPIISYSEASFRTLLRHIPAAYGMLFVTAFVFHLCLGGMDTMGYALAPPTFSAQDFFSYAPYLLTALLIGIFVKFYSITVIYAVGVCLTGYAAILLGLPYFSAAENAAFLVCRFAGEACFVIFAYLLIVTFAMDRQHPLFYAVFGFASLTAARLAAEACNAFLPPVSWQWLLTLLAGLLVIGAPRVHALLKKHGLTRESFALHNALREAIAAKAEALALTDREKYLLELVVLDGYTLDRLPDKMMLSRNTVRAQARNLLKKLDVEELSSLRDYFITSLPSA